MRRRLKVWIYIIAICITTIGGLIVCNYNVNKVKKNHASEKKEQTIKRMHATYKYNVNDLSNIVGDADYVFVAEVDKVVSTVYRNAVKKEDLWISRPYTQYKLKICKNIKGNLSTKKKVTIYKGGGKEKNSNVKYIYDNDRLPVKGKYYIFMAYVQKDGSLLVSGANSTLAVAKNYSVTSNYKKIVTAHRKRKGMSRIRYKMVSSKVYKNN